VILQFTGRICNRNGRPRLLLGRLDTVELLILALNDIGYIKQSAEEAELLYTLIAQRYERRSVMITGNLVFSEWQHIFNQPMATAIRN
jgi:DNA replication protein DnaC